jgi:CRP-like cAMP-binding protein
MKGMTKQSSFFSRLSPEATATASRLGIQRIWPRHANIFRTGDECAGIHIVLEGLVKLYRASATGKEQIVLLEGGGGVLTIVPVLDNGRHLASADTLKATTTLFLSTEHVLRLYREQETFRDLLVGELTRRFRLAVGLLETISLKPVSARVATRVMEVASSENALDGSQEFTMVLSQDELSHVLSTTRESVARAMAELRAAGVIEQNGSKIRVSDAEQLFDCSRQGTPEQSTPLPIPSEA